MRPSIAMLILFLIQLSCALAQADVPFLGKRITEEAITDASFDGGFYIIPNESMNTLQARDIQGEGALISVGTFRVLNVAGYAPSITEVILIDVDPHTVAFNRRHLEIIRASPDLATYFSRLLGVPRDLFKTGSDGSVLPGPGLKETLRALRPGQAAKDPLQRALERLRVIAEKWVDEYPGTGRFPSRAYGEFFFSDMAIFKRVRSMVLSNHVTVFQGSVAGEVTLRQIAEALREKGIRVAAVDSSNVHQYLDISGQAALRENLKRLPLSDDALYLYTGGPEVSIWFGRARSAQVEMPSVNAVFSSDWAHVSAPLSRVNELGLPQFNMDQWLKTFPSAKTGGLELYRFLDCAAKLGPAGP